MSDLAGTPLGKSPTSEGLAVWVPKACAHIHV